MISTKSSCDCAQCRKASTYSSYPSSNNNFYVSSLISEDDIDSASSKKRRQQASIEKQRKRRLAKQQRRKRRKMNRATQRGQFSLRPFTLSRPYATRTEMVQAVRELEAGMKRSQRRPTSTPLPLHYRLTSLQKRGLMENVRRVLIKAKQRLQKGENPQAVLKTLNIQLSNPRFRFIQQLPSANIALQNQLKALSKHKKLKPGTYDAFLQNDFNDYDSFDLAIEALADAAGPPSDPSRPTVRQPHPSPPTQQLITVHSAINQALRYIINQAVVFPKKEYIDVLEKADKLVQRLITYVSSLRISQRSEHRRDLPRTLNLLNAIQRYLRIARSIGIRTHQDIQSALIAAQRATFGLLRGSIFFRR